ncbi:MULTISPECIES: hypothetical protein [unclassified Streptomyces]|uniref:hypothetical protein n=1 Tax=unclassified Streptomyces TaxID=2593676 RepID=UPI00380E71BA
MGKKQTRQNRGARTGGHERSAATEAKGQTKATAPHEAEPPLSKHVAQKQLRKFGHN